MDLFDSIDAKVKDMVQSLVNRVNPKDILDITEAQNRNKINSVVNNLKNPNIGSSMVAAYLHGFGSYVMMLDLNQHKSLISALIELKWFEKEFFVASYYADFVSTFVAAHNEYAEVVFSQIFSVLDGSPFLSEMESQSLDQKGMQARFDQAIKVLRAVLERSPSVLLTLSNVFHFKFPNPRKSRFQTDNYFTNAFHILKLVPLSHRHSFLNIIVEKIRGIDSHADAELLKTLCTDRVSDVTQFFLELEEGSVAVSGTSVEDNPAFENALKLDYAMKLFLNYIHDQCYSGDKLLWKKTKTLFSELLDLFDRHVIKAGELTHLQFFMLYTCSFHEDLTFGFIGYLWKRISDPYFGEPFRLRAISFLTDFVGRCKMASSETVRVNLQSMAEWCSTYITDHQHLDHDTPMFETHVLFYAMTFSVFHLLLFRCSDMLENSRKKKRKFLKSLNIQSLISSHFNPLFYGDESFLRALSNMLQYYEVAYCHSIIEENNRNQLKSQKNLSVLGNILHFPFQRYLLPSSVQLILPQMFVQSDDNDVTCERELVAASKELKAMSLSGDATFYETHDMEDISMMSVSPQHNFVYDAIVGPSMRR